MIAVLAVSRRLTAPRRDDPLRRELAIVAGLAAGSGLVAGLVAATQLTMAVMLTGAALVALLTCRPRLLRLRSDSVVVRAREREVFRDWGDLRRGAWFYWQQRLVVDGLMLAGGTVVVVCLLLTNLRPAVVATGLLAAILAITLAEIVLFAPYRSGEGRVDA